MNNFAFLIVDTYYSFPFFILLFPLTLLLAWQDWRERQVNIGTVLATLVTLVFNLLSLFPVLGIFSILWMYRYCRKNSIQPVDIVLFSFGAGCFPINFLPVYCALTAVVLVATFKISQIKKLPFVVAWAIGFWGTYFIKFCSD